MARFSEIYGIGLSQAQLDFVDIDVSLDNRFYIDPYAIQIRDDEWSANCGDHIRSFFNEVLDALRQGDEAKVDDLLNNLHEPNETCLGQSRGMPSGRGVGQDKARDLAEALRKSRAFSTGILSDVSEAELFIANVGSDTISDLTTNVLRGLLAEYTAQQCDLYGVPTQQVGNIGPVWSIDDRHWHSMPLLLPIANSRPVLLVPKYSVRLSLSLKSQEFYLHHMIEFLRQEHLRNGSSLVKVFKRSGRAYVTKKSVKERHPFIKDDLATFAQQHPEVLEAYKLLKGAKGPLENEDFDESFDEAVFARALINRLPLIATGNAAANQYHNLAMGIMTFLFYPHIIRPIKEREIHEGRKRLDIKYTNAAREGFFHRMLAAPQTRAVSIMAECKNYSRDVENPEFDQLTGRFGHQRGFFGILLCRSLENRMRSVAASKDAANDGRGFMIVFEDADLIRMLEMVEANQRAEIDRFLQDRFDEVSL